MCADIIEMADHETKLFSTNSLKSSSDADARENCLRVN
jgi:hypothetical protein